MEERKRNKILMNSSSICMQKNIYTGTRKISRCVLYVLSHPRFLCWFDEFFRLFFHKIYIQSMDKCLTILMKWSNFQLNGLKLTFFTKCWNDENMKAFTHLGQARPIEQNLVCNNEILKYFRKQKLNFFLNFFLIYFWIIILVF